MKINKSEVWFDVFVFDIPCRHANVSVKVKMARNSNSLITYKVCYHKSAVKYYYNLKGSTVFGAVQYVRKTSHLYLKKKTICLSH